jgi:hypothetical protein
VEIGVFIPSGSSFDNQIPDGHHRKNSVFLSRRWLAPVLLSGSGQALMHLRNAPAPASALQPPAQAGKQRNPLRRTAL